MGERQGKEEDLGTGSCRLPAVGEGGLESWPVTPVCPTARTTLPPCTAQPRC